jgi:hypothetical protein
MIIVGSLAMITSVGLTVLESFECVDDYCVFVLFRNGTSLPSMIRSAALVVGFFLVASSRGEGRAGEKKTPRRADYIG